jgi:biotin operon repressor
MKRIREDQIDFMQKIKSFLHPPLIQFNEENTLSELIQRVERIEDTLQNDQEMETPRKANVKDQIILLLRQHRKLDSSQLSRLIGLSRTRCNEYFRELTMKGVTEGIIAERKKYYKIVKE